VSKAILIITGDGGESYETWYAVHRFQESGYTTRVAAPSKRRLNLVMHDFEPGWDTYKEQPGYIMESDLTFEDVAVADYDAVLCIGGRAPEYLRNDPRVLAILREFDRTGKWLFAICHGVQLLAAAGLVNGKRMKRGLIRAAQDPQRMYDYWISTATETTALAPRAPWIMYEGQDEGYEGMWAQANVKSFSSLKVRATTTRTGNQLLPLPQRILAEPPIQAMMAGIRQSELDIHSVTAFYDASDPRRAGSEPVGSAAVSSCGAPSTVR
jgi:protease I